MNTKLGRQPRLRVGLKTSHNNSILVDLRSYLTVSRMRGTTVRTERAVRATLQAIGEGLVYPNSTPNERIHAARVLHRWLRVFADERSRLVRAVEDAQAALAAYDERSSS